MADVVVVSDISAAVARAIESGVRSSVLEIAREIAAEAQESIRSRPKSGRTYRRGGRSYTASAPGEPPANVTGALADSITARADGDGAIVSATGEIAHTMEFGTAGGKIAPRPFLVPAAEAKRAELEKSVSAAVRAVTG